MTTQTDYTFDNLHIVKTIITGPTVYSRFLTVERNEGNYWLTLTPQDPDYSKAIILMLNKENEDKGIS